VDEITDEILALVTGGLAVVVNLPSRARHDVKERTIREVVPRG
jgi:hypothetical protein